MYGRQAVWVGSSSDGHCTLYLKQVSRHSLIAGATGTSKTATFKVMAESFSDADVSVFLADVKGGLVGICQPGEDSADMQTRIACSGLQKASPHYRAYPTEFWGVFGKQDFLLHVMVSEFRPLLFTRLLDPNKIQSDLLGIIFRIANEEGLLLLDMRDLKSMVRCTEKSVDACREQYSNIGKNSTGATLRAFAALEGKDGAQFFGEPALQISDQMRVDADGKGYVNILGLTSLIQDPTIYSTFILWMLNELFTELPEASNLEKPKMVFFLGEAHLLLDNAPKALLDKVEQVVKLIRPKGVGIYFITQSPSDIPSGVSAQLGNKVQHAFCACMPAEQKGVKAVAGSLRRNPAFDTATALQELKTVEALVPFPDEGGAPEEVWIASTPPPQSKSGALDAVTEQVAILASSLHDKYAEGVDRELAYEPLLQRVDKRVAAVAEVKEEAEAEKQAVKEVVAAEKQAVKEAATTEKQTAKEAAVVVKQTEKEAAAAAREEEKKVAQQKRIFASTGDSVTGTIGEEVGEQLRKSAGDSFGKQLDDDVGAGLGRGIPETSLKS